MVRQWRSIYVVVDADLLDHYNFDIKFIYIQADLEKL
jgi:hypothetical protein